eukprot:3711675-Amphidinium_carterae.1
MMCHVPRFGMISPGALDMTMIRSAQMKNEATAAAEPQVILDTPWNASEVQWPSYSNFARH